MVLVTRGPALERAWGLHTPEDIGRQRVLLRETVAVMDAASIARMYGCDAGGVTRVRLGVGVAVFDSDGRLLLECRADCGWWGLPGGAVNPGETVVAAAVREVEEESGLQVAVERFVGVYSDPRHGRIVTYPDRGDRVHLVDIVVLARPRGGALRTSPESLEVRFFSSQELPVRIVPPARQPIADVVGGALSVLA